MPFKKIMKGNSLDALPDGFFSHDSEALSACQRECAARFGNTVQIEQESYLSHHPEIKAMLSNFVATMVNSNKRKGILKEAAEYFTRPVDVLNEEIRKTLGIETPSYIKPGTKPFRYVDKDLVDDLRATRAKHYPIEVPPLEIPEPPTPDTVSSSFVSIITSDTTLPTPEPIPTPDPTLEEILYGYISNAVDKAIYFHVNDDILLYDTAYVELMKSVEEAMEIPVIEIREDIATLFYNAYKMFEIDIMEKERIAAEIAWEKRMRKKLKRTLRRVNNFRGYETPPTPKSEISSHESYKRPPPRPCVCAPKYKYNRYAKDRFGIYLPREEGYCDYNVTTTPAISVESVLEGEGTEEKNYKKSALRKKSYKDDEKKATTFQN